MANNNETTTKFKVDISELKRAMQDAKRQISIANSEFRAASSAMDDWSTSTDGISAKLRQLDSNLRSQKTILSSLEQQYEAVAAEQGEGSAAADRLKIAINNQKAVINKTEREIGNYEESLKEVGEAEKIAAKSGKDVSEVLDELGNKAEDAGDGFTTLKGAVATFAGNMLTGLVDGIKEGISSFIGLADETREYRSELAKLETAFTTAGFSSQTATQTYKDLYEVLGDEGQAVEAANHLAKLTDNEQDLARWTTIATGVYGTFGDSLPIEGLTEAANETAKTGALTGGLADALNWAGVSEEDFQASLDKCSTEQERQALITDTLNGLYSDAAKKYEETNKSVMDANRANSDYTDTLATMGATLEPVTTTLKEGFNGLLQELLKLVGDVDIATFTSKIEESFKVLTDDVLPAAKDGLGWIIDNKDIIIAGLAGIATGFAAFKVAGVISAVTSALQGMTVATALAAAKQWLLNTALLANPIGLVVALVAGLVAAFVVLWNKSDSFRQFWIDLWEKIKTACGEAKDWLANKIDEIGKFFTETLPAAFNSVISWIKKNWQSLLLMLINPFAGLFKYFYDNNGKFKQFVDNAIAQIKQLPTKVHTWLLATINKVGEWAGSMYAKASETASKFVNTVSTFISELPSKVWTWLLNTASKVGQWAGTLAAKGAAAARSLVTSVVNVVTELPSKMLSIGGDIVAGLWSGISDKVGWLKSQISSFVGDVTSWLKEFFGIHSPSKLMADEVGKWLPEGIAVGIDKNAKSVLSSMKDLATGTVGAARAGLSSTTTTGGVVGGVVAGGVINNFNQTIYSPKQLSRLDIYRQSKNLLGYAGR